MELGRGERGRHSRLREHLWASHFLKLPSEPLPHVPPESPTETQSRQTGPVTSPAPSTETGTGGPPSIGYSPETHTVMRKPDRVHFKEVDCMVYELYLNKASIWKRRRRRRRKEGKEGGKEGGRERGREEEARSPEIRWGNNNYQL